MNYMKFFLLLVACLITRTTSAHQLTINDYGYQEQQIIRYILDDLHIHKKGKFAVFEYWYNQDFSSLFKNQIALMYASIIAELFYAGRTCLIGTKNSPEKYRFDEEIWEISSERLKDILYSIVTDLQHSPSLIQREQIKDVFLGLLLLAPFLPGFPFDLW